MDLIYTDLNGKEMGFVRDANIDIEIGNGDDILNDFEIEYNRQRWTGELEYGCRVFVPGTEFGGIIKELATDTSADSITVKGYTWRGMLVNKVISPLSGQDYRFASGELNQIIRSFVETEFPGLFYGSNENTGVSIDNFQFDRYVTLHAGLTKMLQSVGYRLDIKYKQPEDDSQGYVIVKAVPITDFSKDYELSNDQQMNFTMDENYRGVNHLICLGKGELKDRLVINLYTDAEGNISQNQSYFGTDEIALVYDSSGSEYDDLMENGIKKLTEERNRAEYNMALQSLDIEVEIGDIVGGRDYITGVALSKPIERKIWTVSAGKEDIEYKLEGAN